MTPIFRFKQARKPRSYASPKLCPLTHSLTDLLTGVKCRATSVAKKNHSLTHSVNNIGLRDASASKNHYGLAFVIKLPHCSETKFNPNVPQLTSSLQIIISYIYTCHFNKKSKYFTESFSRYCPCTLGACVHAHLEKFLDFSFQLA